MGKSSSSLKKKRSKKSSKVKASRSKIRKHKSKKVRRREVSLSSSDYDDSESLDTSSSSSSGESYRRKRNQSRTRKEVKGRKKRARRRSYSRDSSEDSLNARKSKKAKRKNEHDDVEGKSHQKKKIRREASLDSVDSRSLSCSTCQGGSASDVDSQYDSRRGRPDRKEKDKRRLKERSSRSEMSSRYRARSSSSCSPCCESSYEGTKEKYTGEDNSRRLRSVITVTKEAEESRELCRNEAKEEIVDDHDYPCRSNDSNDGGTKRELDLLASEGELRVEDEMGDSDADLNTPDPKLRVSSYGGRSNFDACNAVTSESLKETGETSGANLNGDDLESILRQRALENLRKFRGAVHSTAKDSNQENKIVSKVKQPITDEHKLVQGKSIVHDAAVATKFDKRTPVEETNLPVQEPEHGSLQSFSSLKQTPVLGLPREKLVVPENIKDTGTSAAARVVSRGGNDNVNNIRELSSAAPNKPSVHGPKFRQTKLNKGKDDVNDQSRFELKQTSASHEPPNAKMTEGDVERNATKSTKATIRSANNSGRVIDELHNSATPKSGLESSSVENNSGKLQDESNQDSQFEQKTVKKMIGGKMVEASYKVYIPKKVPALARRQLKR